MVTSFPIMKFGLYGLHKGENTPPDAFVRRAKLAEDAGFESIWVGDHIALPLDAPDDAYEARLEAVVALAHLAAVTTRVKLGLGVIILPQRQPVLLAKQLTSLDVLSGGRLIAGFGVGYLEKELGALGSALSERGARTDESLAAMRALWDEPVPSFEGRFVSFGGVLQRPRPDQRPHPPIVIGGESAAAYRRASHEGDGWYGWQQTPEQVAQIRTRLREDLEITITPPLALDAGLVRAYADAGVDRLVVQPPAATGAATEALIAATAELIRS
jgi:probable F420-dependent oxidoreductase